MSNGATRTPPPAASNRAAAVIDGRPLVDAVIPRIMLPLQMHKSFPPPAGFSFPDLQVMPPEKAWNYLRALRHKPPGRAQIRQRREVFVSALEQAEQLFKAASQVPYASRPILIFYALSQAGRAIVAADQGTSDNWELSGHGIRVTDMDGPLDKILVRDDGFASNTSFRRVATVLDSPGLSAPVPLARIWDTIPELSRWPLKRQ